MSRDEKVQKRFYFAFEANPSVGFTDNLNQFRGLHKLATSLGGVYVHRPLSASRSPDGIYQFVGLDDGFEHSVDQPAFQHLKIRRVRFNRQLTHIDTFEALQAFWPVR